MRWSQRTKRAIAFLFRPYNDIDVFVEDSVSLGMYEVLLGRMLRGEARITRVHQLGNRATVVAECQRDQLPSGRRRLYIIDADSDLVFGTPAPALLHLYRLGVYTSENLLFSKAAALEIAYESLTNVERAAVDNILAFDDLVAQLTGELVPLFVWYAAVYSLDNRIETVGYSVMQLCSSVGGVHELDAAKVSARIAHLEAALVIGVTQPVVDATVASLSSQVPRTAESLARFVSGKTYLLPLLFHRLRFRTSLTGNLEQFKVRLARYAEIDIDPGLLDAVTACSRG